RHFARAIQRSLGDPGDPNRTPGATRDLFRVAPKHGPGSEAHGPDSQQANLEGLHFRAVHLSEHQTPSSRNICRIPLIACRVRGSFSIIANRTYGSPNSPKPIPGDTETFARAS